MAGETLSSLYLSLHMLSLHTWHITYSISSLELLDDILVAHVWVQHLSLTGVKENLHITKVSKSVTNSVLP